MLKILTNWWWEILIKPLEKYLKNVEIIWLREKKYQYNDYNTFLKVQTELKKNQYDIVHLNSWFDIFLLRKQKWVKYIFESHGFHPWISIKYSLLITESILNKFFVFFFYPIFKILFFVKIKNVDLYLVSIPWLIKLTKKYNSYWLPNPVDTKIFYKRETSLKLDKNFINVFYPTWLREVKNPKFAFELMNKIIDRYENIRFYFIKQSVSNYNKYSKYLEKIEKNIIWIDQLNREELPYYYSADWDLVLGSFYPEKEYAILNLIELEAMACKAPIIAHDLHEVILISLDELRGDFLYKMIDDKEFKRNYIERNYQYILEKHSLEEVSKIYYKKILTLN